MKRLALLALVLACVLGLGAGCGDDDIMTGPPPVPAASGSARASASASAGAPSGPDADAGAFVAEFSENDFVESDDSRDPYRSFAALFLTQAKARTVVQRKVRASQFALDELKLAGIITRGDPRALVTDPGGLGWVLHSGDYVGKSEIVSTGGPTGVDVALNWRVDRIRETDVVFLREDPAHPEIPPTTKVMYLHPADLEERPLGGMR